MVIKMAVGVDLDVSPSELFVCPVLFFLIFPHVLALCEANVTFRLLRQLSAITPACTVPTQPTTKPVLSREPEPQSGNNAATSY